MTAQEVYDSAIALIDQVTDNPAENEDYAAKTPQLLTTFQREVARLEGVGTAKITSLDDEMSVSDEMCETVLAYKLAYWFAVSDNQANKANELYGQYQMALRNMKAVSTPIQTWVDPVGGM